MNGLDWLWWTIGAATGLAGLALLYTGLLHDRARGRRRCPRCWYDLAGLPALACPECGRVARRERSLGRTRRRWRIALIGLLVAGAGAASVGWPSVRTYGWWRLVPLDVLVRVLPAPGNELDPKTRAIRPSLAELQRRVPAQTFAGRHWRTFLAHSGVLRVPKRWPADMPLAVIAQKPAISLGSLIEIRATARIAGAPTLFIGQTKPVQWRPGAYSPTVVGSLAPSVRSVTFDIEVLSGEEALKHWDGTPAQIWRGSVTFPIRLIDSVDEVMRPDATPSLSQLVARAISVSGALDDDRRFMSVSINRAIIPGDVSLGVRIDVLHNDTVVGGRDYPARPDPAPAAVFFVGQELDPFRVSDRLPADTTEAQGWTLRVRGTGRLAITDFARARYWSGEYSVPLSSVMRDLVDLTNTGDIGYDASSDSPLSPTGSRAKNGSAAPVPIRDPK